MAKLREAKDYAPEWNNAETSKNRTGHGWTDIRTYIPSEEAKKSLWGRIGFIVVVLALIFIIVYVYAWATSPSGERTLTNVKAWMSAHNPATWYLGKLETAKAEVSSSWSAVPNQTKKGIIFEDFSVVGSGEIMQGMPLTLNYNLKVSEANLENVPITLTCKIPSKYTTEIGKEIEGEILPANPLIVTGKRIADSVRCRFGEEITSKLQGTLSAEATASFPFETKDVKLKVYFISDKAYQQLGDEDFFDYYNINERLPIRASYNGEPVEIGIGVSNNNEQPVIARTDYPLLIGITLWNRWDGEVKSITDLTIELPKGLAIDEKVTKNPTPLCPFVASRSGKTSNEYKLIPNLVEGKKIEKGKMASFECWLKITPELLGDSLYTVKEYKASTSYVYELSKRQAAFTIKAPETSSSMPLVVS